MKNKFLILFICLIPSNTDAFFGKNVYGTYATQITKINPNPRCSAMGDACSSDVYDATSLDINPANLIKIKNISISLSHLKYFEDISLSSIFFAKNIAKNIGTFGFGIKNLNWGSIEKTDEFATNLGKYSPSETMLIAGFSSYISSLTEEEKHRFVFGGTGKVIVSKVDKSATTLSTDIGILFPYMFEERFALSFVLQNIIGNLKIDKETFPVPKIIKISGTIYASRDITITSDIIAPQDSITYLSLGIEWRIKLSKRNAIFLRGGITSKNISELENYSPLSFGFGVKYNNLHLDYSISNMGYLGDVNKISISMNY